MTDFSDFLAQIADFENRADWSPALVISFVRMAESKFNSELRISRMIRSLDALIAARCAPLPDDWLEMTLIRLENDNAPTGFLPIRYKSRDEFFNLPDTVSYGYYTIEGRQVFFGGTPNTVDGQTVRMTYFAEVPVMSDIQGSWVYDKYPSLYLYGSLMHADLHAVGEEQNAANMKTLTEDMIGKLNKEHLIAKASGSRVTRTRVRSFG